jgi:hypothetical protein
VLVVGHNTRSITRLSGMIRDYAEDAEITGVSARDREKSSGWRRPSMWRWQSNPQIDVLPACRNTGS